MSSMTTATIVSDVSHRSRDFGREVEIERTAELEDRREMEEELRLKALKRQRRAEEWLRESRSSGLESIN